MDDTGPGVDSLAIDCGRAAATYFLGGQDRFDLAHVLAAHGIDRDAQDDDEPDPASVVGQLVRIAGPLQQATAALAATAVAGNQQALPLAGAQAELWRTADPNRLQAIARAIEHWTRDNR